MASGASSRPRTAVSSNAVDGLDEQPGHAVGRTDNAEAGALPLDRGVASEDRGNEILARRGHEGDRRKGSRWNRT